MDEFNRLSHFIWAGTGTITSYGFSRFGINEKYSAIASVSFAFSASIAKEIHDYISSYPSFLAKDTTGDLCMDITGITAGVLSSYGLSRLYKLVKSGQSRETRRQE